jgi:hypothetical protein
MGEREVPAGVLVCELGGDNTACTSVWIHRVGTEDSVDSGRSNAGSGDRGAFSTLISNTSVDLFHCFVSEPSSDAGATDMVSVSAPARSMLRDGWFATITTP